MWLISAQREALVDLSLHVQLFPAIWSRVTARFLLSAQVGRHDIVLSPRLTSLFCGISVLLGHRTNYFCYYY